MSTIATETLNLPEDLRQALDQAVAATVEIAHPQLIILFGSWAEGTAREDSDVDLLVVAETETGTSRHWLRTEPCARSWVGASSTSCCTVPRSGVRAAA